MHDEHHLVLGDFYCDAVTSRVAESGVSVRPIPLDCEAPTGFVKRIIAAPDGDLTNDEIRPVEAFVGAGEDGIPRYIMCILLEPEDLVRISEGVHYFWLTVLGTRLSPFDMVMGGD